MDQSKPLSTSQVDEFFTLLRNVNMQRSAEESGQASATLTRMIEEAYSKQKNAIEVDALYRLALTSDDADVRSGLGTFLDALLTYESPSKLFDDDADPFTFSFACEVALEHSHALEKFDSTEALRAEISKSINIEPSRINVCAQVVNPDHYPHSMMDLVSRVFLARAGREGEAYFRQNEVIPDSESNTMIRCFLVTISLGQNLDTAGRIMAMRARDLGAAVALPYSVGNAEFTASVMPLEIGLPFWTITHYAYVGERNFIDDEITQVLDGGHKPSGLAIEFQTRLMSVEESQEFDLDSATETLLIMNVTDIVNNQVLLELAIMSAQDAVFALNPFVDLIFEKGIADLTVFGQKVTPADE